MMITLRPYQVTPIRKAIDYFRESDPEPALIVCPTAWGKSLMAAEVAAACPDPILVVQPTKELLEQNLSKYRLLCGDLAPAGIYSAYFGKKQIDHVTFATIGSIKSIGAQFRQLGFKKMLIDEVHLYPRTSESMLGQFLKDSGITHVLGITATPLKQEHFSEKAGERFNKWSELIMLTNPAPSGNFFKRIIHVSQVREMTGQGFWSPLRYEVLPFDRSALKLNTSGNEYEDQSVVESYILNNVRANIYAALDWHTERKHCLVFVPSVEEAAILAADYPDAAMVCGETPKKERAAIIDAFRTGKIRVLFNVAVLGTGFDYPEIDMIVFAMSTASVARYYQFAGRGVRIAPHKKDCVVVDMGGNVERFGRIEDISFEFDGKWRMFGSGGTLLSGLPVQCVGNVTKGDLDAGWASAYSWDTISFGKHKGKRFEDVPVYYLAWLLTTDNFGRDYYLRARAVIAMENHIRDTRLDPPATVMPDGKHAGEQISTVPSGYLRYYYGSKDWNETNDSLRRGILAYLKTA